MCMIMCYMTNAFLSEIFYFFPTSRWGLEICVSRYLRVGYIVDVLLLLVPKGFAFGIVDV